MVEKWIVVECSLTKTDLTDPCPVIISKTRSSPTRKHIRQANTGLPPVLSAGGEHTDLPRRGTVAGSSIGNQFVTFGLEAGFENGENMILYPERELFYDSNDQHHSDTLDYHWSSCDAATTKRAC